MSESLDTVHSTGEVYTSCLVNAEALDEALSLISEVNHDYERTMIRLVCVLPLGQELRLVLGVPVLWLDVAGAALESIHLERSGGSRAEAFGRIENSLRDLSRTLAMSKALPAPVICQCGDHIDEEDDGVGATVCVMCRKAGRS